VDWRAASRVLVIGEVRVPRIDVKTFVSGDTVRVVLEASEAVPFRVSQEEGRVTVAIPRDLVSVAFQQQRLTGGIVETVQFLGGRDNVFTVTLGRRFKSLTASEQAGPARLVMEFQAAPLSVAGPPPGDAPGSPFRPTAPAQGGGIRTVVIDPGHGGAEVGATGPGGTLEKDVTLAIGRKVRSALTSSLGLQAFLTRDKDHEVALDDRTAFANNYKADLFVSIHANASAARGARGSEVYFLSYQASDEESRRLATSEGGVIDHPGLAAAGGTSDLALILWDMAQAEHLEESSALATRINEELAEVTGSQGRGIKQAPFRVLVGAGMPAVLVEVAFISNAEEEKLLTSEAYQSKVAAALVKGIARYHHERSQAVASTPARPGR
jgi:N-acetylmuramoyl-L-alanine amidase